ncbi:MAG: hypothetical protein KAU84_04635 [Thermoplasmatales archaeon]|nr:hypothetical protein [Thermoplasmatales archaeon]
MNKKILMGSILAVVILILVSFTGVVGYQTTKSSTIDRASPLFTVRSSRAIDEDSEDFTCDYFGKGEDAGIPIPKRSTTNALIGKIFQRISKMDENEINKLIVTLKVHQKDIKNIDIDEIQQYMDDSEMLNNNFTLDPSVPGGLLCELLYIIMYILMIPYIIILGLLGIVFVLIPALLAIIVIAPFLIILGIITMFLPATFSGINCPL